MKKLLLWSIFLTAAHQFSWGEVFGTGTEGWTYSVIDGNATITSYSGPGGAVVIPSAVDNGIPVKVVGDTYPSIFSSARSPVTRVTIPDSVTSIGTYAFNGCTKLASVYIPYGTKSIGNRAFYGCTSLTSISSLGSSINIGEAAFYGCTSLSSIILPPTLTSIGLAAFASCTSLTGIAIPQSVTSIDTNAFYGCTGLSSVNFGGNIPSYIGQNIFMNAPATIYYLAGATGWESSFAGRPTSAIGSSYHLSTFCDTSIGTLATNPLKNSYISGEIVAITASPIMGYVFSNWSGASSATTSSITLTMNADKTVTANFAQDGRDADGDGLTNYQESITYGTNPNQKDTNSDGIEDGQAVALGYSPTFNFSALISHLQSHPPTGLFTISQYTDNYTAGQTSGRAEVTGFPASYNLYSATQYNDNYNTGKQSVLENPNAFQLYTTSQIQNMAVGDLVLSRQVNGGFVLNYDIEQSTDLQNWTPYQTLSLPLTGLPTDKAFIRIKAKQ